MILNFISKINVIFVRKNNDHDHWSNWRVRIMKFRLQIGGQHVVV